MSHLTPAAAPPYEAVTVADVAKALAGLAVHNLQLPDAEPRLVAKAWHRVLADLTPAELAAGVERFVATGERFPTAGLIRQAARAAAHQAGGEITADRLHRERRQAEEDRQKAQEAAQRVARRRRYLLSELDRMHKRAVRCNPELKLEPVDSTALVTLEQLELAHDRARADAQARDAERLAERRAQREAEEVARKDAAAATVNAALPAANDRRAQVERIVAYYESKGEPVPEALQRELDGVITH